MEIARFLPHIAHIGRMVLTTVENAAGANGHRRERVRFCVSSPYAGC
jgi:hypothetical protein